MKVLHLPFTYYPDPVGGTETYVAALIECLRKQGVDGIVAAPAAEPATYSVQGTSVSRLAISGERLTLRALYGEGDARVAEQFARLLDREQPDLVHMHAFTSAVSLQLVRIARVRDIPVVFTYHTPSVSCQRGTLLRWGKAACDGRLDRYLCTQCTLHGLGMNKLSSMVVGALPPPLGRFLGKQGRQGGPWTALRMSELIALRHDSVRSCWEEVDSIVAVCAWVRDLLMRNGVAAHKITVSRHGLIQRPQGASQRGPNPRTHGSLKLAFLGRLDPIKGVDLLVRALRALPRAAIDLDIYGISQGEADDRYRSLLVELASGDRRVSFLEPVPSEQVAEALLNYDMLAVPSQWMETGPLVVLEAFACGLPVLGSDLGGITERVEDGMDGLLVRPHNSVEAWADALETLVRSPRLVERLTSGVKPPRGMDDVARDMFTVYEGVLASATEETIQPPQDGLSR